MIDLTGGGGRHAKDDSCRAGDDQGRVRRAVQVSDGHGDGCTVWKAQGRESERRTIVQPNVVEGVRAHPRVDQLRRARLVAGLVIDEHERARRIAAVKVRRAAAARACRRLRVAARHAHLRHA